MNLYFKTPAHQQRLFQAIREIGKVASGKLDPEYGAALYILTADEGTWQQASQYVSSEGIEFEEMLEQQDFSSGYSVLINLAGNLFNGQQHIDPHEFLRLDEDNWQIALTAIQLRRYPLKVSEAGG